MGNSLEQYRQAIGLFNATKMSFVPVDIGISLYTAGLILLSIMHFLLLLSGDIELNPGPFSKLKSLSICHVNIRGLAESKLRSIKTSLCERYDIITISETFLGPLSSVDLTIPGFNNIIRRDRPTFGGGLAVYIRNTISFKRRVNFDCKDIENLWLEINTLDGKVLICTVYRPPNNCEFWQLFNDNIDFVKSEAGIHQLLILGDLNADHETANGKKLKDTCISNDLKIHINEPTRITSSSKTCLDQIISNIPNFVARIVVDPPVDTNDHCTVGAYLKFKLPFEKAYYRSIWQYDRGNYIGFKAALETTDWNLCFESDNVDIVCNTWTSTFLKIARTYIPNKAVLIRPRDSPWYTGHLHKMRRKVIRLYHNAKEKMNQYHWNRYKSLNKEYHNELDNAEKVYEESLNKSLCKNRNAKGWWKTVNQLIGRGNDSSYPPLQDLNSNEFVSDSKQKASLFNDFFLSHSDIDTSNVRLPAVQVDTEIKLSDIIVTDQEVKDLIQILDTSKSTGCDEISPKLVSIAGDSIVSPLTRLFNLCLHKNKLPSLWKKANVIPIHKKDEKDKLNNYRPVSILPVLSKIFERVIFKHVYNFFHEHKLLSNHQSGFRPNDSTVNQLAYLYHTFSQALDNKKDLRIVFCDISKAFDRVWHDGIIFKLHQMGISGNLLCLFKDYLNERQQRVTIRGQSSDWGYIRAGVPQGSVLGPLLFLVYINDIVDKITCDIKLFADDTILYVTVDDYNLSTELLNANLKKIEEWSNQWLVSFNPQKTKLLNMSYKREPPFDDFPVYFNDVQILSVREHKHLGLCIDDKLKWSLHVDAVISSVSKMIDVLQKLKYSLDRHTLQTIYFSFIRPKLEYGSIVWDDCSEYDKLRLENTQLRCARIVSGAKKGTSHELIYQELAWSTLSERRKFCKKKFMFNIVNNHCPPYLHDTLPMNVQHRHNLRNDSNIRNFKARTDKFRTSILPDCIRLWNDLPSVIKNLPSIESFKTAIQIKPCVNMLYYGINRRLSVIHAQLRMNCSNLNSHLFNLHVVDNPFCYCSVNLIEDSYHFFFDCPLYHTNRLKLFESIINIQPIIVSIDVLLYGSNELSFEKNVKLFECIESYISDTDRF